MVVNDHIPEGRPTMGLSSQIFPTGIPNAKKPLYSTANGLSEPAVLKGQSRGEEFGSP
jgi:hypothetical protein